MGKLKLNKETAEGMLFFTAVLWGLSSCLLKAALETGVTAGFINFARGAVFVALAALFFHRDLAKIDRRQLKVGLIAGLLNFAGYLVQTVGMKETSPANSAFISSTYVVFVPIFAMIFYRVAIKKKIFCCAVLSMAGAAILSGMVSNGFSALNRGDFFALISALFYAGSVVYLGHGTKDTPPTVVAFLLAAVQAVGGLAYFLAAEGGHMPNVDWLRALPMLLVMGVLCSFAAQTMQVMAQQHTSPTAAGMIMMLEGLFSAVISVMVGYDAFGWELAVGGAVITASLAVMEVDFSKLLQRARERETGESAAD